MSTLPSKVSGVLGNTSLSQFDVIIVGSGAGGATAARTLTVAGGKKVLILETGNNYFIGLDDPAPDKPTSTANPDEDFSGVDAATAAFLKILVRVGGGPHFP